MSAGLRRCRNSPTSLYETVGSAALGVSQHAANIGMLFFCLGGLLWYSLLLRSRIVPRLLALWGLVAVPLALVATSLLVWNPSLDPSIALYALYVPFELVLGLWLLIRGANLSSTHPVELSARDGDLSVRQDVGNASER